MRDPAFIDLETHLFGPGHMAPKPVSGAVHEVPERFHPTPRLWLWAEREPVLMGVGPERPLVGHHIAYDTACMLAHAPELGPAIWDAYEAGGILCSKLREKLIAIAGGEMAYYREGSENRKASYSLGDLCARHLGAQLDKGADGWRTRYAELDGVPIDQWPERARAYAIGDVVELARLWEHQTVRLERMNYTAPTLALESRASFALQLMSAWGIHTDGARVAALRSSLAAEQSTHVEALVEAGLLKSKRKAASALPGMGDALEEAYTKNAKRLAEIIEADCRRRGVEPARTKTGRVQTDADAIEACGDERLEHLRAYAAAEKLLGTYVAHLDAGSGETPIHARFETLGAESSRTSCGAPNLQNQPKKNGVRECFVPRPGCVFVACDFKTQEIITLAQSCVDLLGRSTLAKRYQEDPSFDPHLEFAAGMLRISVDEAKARKKAEDPGIDDARQRAKAANFGFPGGLGAQGFVAYARGYGLTLSIEEASAIRDHWFETWSDMRDYFALVTDLTRGDWGVQVIPRSGFRRAGVSYTNCANGFFQTLAAHASKAALWDVTRRCYDARLGSVLLGSRPVVFVHDEIIVEAPEEVAHEVADELERVMAAAMQKWTPDVPCAAEAVVMRWWSKKAKDRRGPDGRRLVWPDGEKT